MTIPTDILRLGNRGVSILELIAAIAILVFAVVSASQLLPKAMQSTVQNHQRMMALNLARAKLQDLKSSPYAQVLTTPDATFAVTTPPCDCSQRNLTTNPDTVTPGVTEVIAQNDQTNFTRTYCVNQVIFAPGPAGGVQSQCLATAPGDTRMKNVIVQVSWVSSGHTLAITQETMVEAQ